MTTTVSGNNKPTKFYEWYLVVEGSGTFPFDMLRYDSCFPWEQEDAAKLEHHHDEMRRVVLIRRGKSDSPGNFKRWLSFGWVVMVATIDSYEAQRARKADAK